MPFYMKKPVVIEACKLAEENKEEILNWINKEGYAFNNPVDKNGIIIYTKEGYMGANKGDYIIKGIKGEFYPCKSDIFHLTYEEISSKEDK